jgi:hypothetical protein
LESITPINVTNHHQALLQKIELQATAMDLQCLDFERVKSELQAVKVQRDNACKSITASTMAAASQRSAASQAEVSLVTVTSERDNLVLLKDHYKNTVTRLRHERDAANSFIASSSPSVETVVRMLLAGEVEDEEEIEDRERELRLAIAKIRAGKSIRWY